MLTKVTDHKKVVSARLKKDIIQKLKKIAKLEKRSLSQVIEMRLEKTV